DERGRRLDDPLAAGGRVAADAQARLEDEARVDGEVLDRREANQEVLDDERLPVALVVGEVAGLAPVRVVGLDHEAEHLVGGGGGGGAGRKHRGASFPRTVAFATRVGDVFVTHQVGRTLRGLPKRCTMPAQHPNSRKRKQICVALTADLASALVSGPRRTCPRRRPHPAANSQSQGGWSWVIA